MRISSPFKDYYDHLQAFTIGQSKIWSRIWSDSEVSKLFTNLYYDYTYTGNTRHDEERCR